MGPPCVFYQQRADYAGSRLAAESFPCSHEYCSSAAVGGGALHLMEGWQVQDEVSVAGLTVDTLAVPVFDLDESPPLQLIERAPRCVFRTAAAVCGGPRKAVLCFVGKGGARERTQFSPRGGNGVERTLRRRRPTVFFLTGSTHNVAVHRQLRRRELVAEDRVAHFVVPFSQDHLWAFIPFRTILRTED